MKCQIKNQEQIHSRMVKRTLIAVVTILALTSLALNDVRAIVRRRLPAQKVTRGIVSSSWRATVRFRSDRRAIIVNFSGLNTVNSVTYLLSYETNGKAEGSQGVIRPQGEADASRELVFGTCSTTVCTYHQNIKNARFVISAQLKNGKTVQKAYRIKV